MAPRGIAHAAGWIEYGTGRWSQIKTTCHATDTVGDTPQSHDSPQAITSSGPQNLYWKFQLGLLFISFQLATKNNVASFIQYEYRWSCSNLIDLTRRKTWRSSTGHKIEGAERKRGTWIDGHYTCITDHETRWPSKREDIIGMGLALVPCCFYFDSRY